MNITIIPGYIDTQLNHSHVATINGNHITTINHDLIMAFIGMTIIIKDSQDQEALSQDRKITRT